jgi:lysophospholipase
LGEAAPLCGTDLAPVPRGARAEWFSGAGGAKLRAALFPAATPARGSVVLSSGRTEPIEKYFEVASELSARGFVVLANEWRGQGLSQRLLPERIKGHAVGYGDFLTDYDALIAAFEAELPKPWLAVGHSMGGCLTALALARDERRFAGAALSAPMFGVFTQPFPRPVAVTLASVLQLVGQGASPLPGAALTADPAAFEANVLTHDPRRYARNNGQVTACPDLALGPPTWSWLDFAFKAMAELKSGPDAPKVDIPVVVVAAGDDRLVDNRDTRAVTARFPKGRYVEVPGAYHEILQETDDIRAVFWREFDALVAGL